MSSKGAFFIFILGMVTFPSIDSSTVPVVGWSSTRNLFATRQISAGEEISPDSLRNDFLDKALGKEPQTIVLVLLNKLSLGDLTRYGDAYGHDSQGGVIPNIKMSMDSATSTMVVPQTDTSELVEDLVSKVTGRQGEVTEVKDFAELKNFRINPTKSNLVIVYIEPSDSMEEQLTTADGYVKTAMELFKGETPPRDFTLFFTAVKTSKGSKSSGRHLLQTEEEATAVADSADFLFLSYNESGCRVFIYANSTTAKLYNKQTSRPVSKQLLPTQGWTLNGTNCSANSTIDLKFGISDIKTANGSASWITSVFVTMNIIETDGWWSVNNTVLSYQLENQTTKSEPIMLPLKLETPLDWSYHCGDLNFEETNITGESLTLYFNDFQIQPFRIEDDKFSQANECVGFFTGPIWMGLLTALLVIAVISFGLSMMAAVRVMDKFDDPKGKELVINVPDS